MARVFDLISSEYNWDDEVILDKTLRRIRQIIAAISLRKIEEQKQQRLIASWQTRSLAMVCAAAGPNSNEELMKFASNLTIDNDEYEQFNSGQVKIAPTKKLPIHATTQDEATKNNFEVAADRNNFDVLAMFGEGMMRTPPGQ
jgi:hypothetical protein